MYSRRPAALTRPEAGIRYGRRPAALARTHARDKVRPQALGGLRASTLDGTCVWKIVGFSGY